MEFENGVAPEKRLVALVLVYIFGGLGIHRFYVGKKGTAVAQIVLSFCVIIFYLLVGGNKVGANKNVAFVLPMVFIGSILGVWVFIDMVKILFGVFRNSNGQKLVDWT